MTSLFVQTDRAPVAIDVSSLLPQMKITDEQFYAFCLDNQDLRIERSALGEVIVTPPVSSDAGNRENRIAYQLTAWSDRNGTGEVFGASTGFRLPNGATRAPDASWISSDRWEALCDEQKASFAPICTDFVVELRSASDTLASVQRKMQEYIENGARLGLLIDRLNRTVYVYRPERSRSGHEVPSPQLLANPDRVSC